MSETNKTKAVSVNYLYVAIFTTITALAWAGFELGRSLTKPAALPEVKQELLAPLSSQLDQEALKLVAGRIHLSQDLLDSFEPTKTSVLLEEEEKEATASGTSE